MINNLFLSGRAADDPVLKEGKKSLILRMAVPRYDSSARQTVDEFYSVWVHGKLAEIVVEHVRKGDRIFIQGHCSMFKRENAQYAEVFLHADNVEFMPKAVAKPAEDPNFNPDF